VTDDSKTPQADAEDSDDIYVPSRSRSALATPGANLRPFLSHREVMHGMVAAVPDTDEMSQAGHLQ
jgi:hypothetical protein